MEKICVLVNAEFRERVFSEKYYDRLRKLGEVKIYDKADFSDTDYVIEFVKGSTVIVTSWDSPQIDKQILDACPNLKGVIHGAGSIKPILSDEFIKRKIRITNSAVAIGEGVAESALGFAISASKGFYTLSDDTKRGLWQENIKQKVKDFYDITVGVISGGYVGSHMVKLLKNFHVDVLMYDPILTSEKISNIGAKKVELNELMSLSDVISIHAPGIPATENMINASNLSLMKDGAILINTARGTIINEHDLIAELKKGRIFACLDVTYPEPPSKDNELRTLPNVVLTPHIAGLATNGKLRIGSHVCDEIENYNSNAPLYCEVKKEMLSKMA